MINGAAAKMKNEQTSTFLALRSFRPTEKDKTKNQIANDDSVSPLYGRKIPGCSGIIQEEERARE